MNRLSTAMWMLVIVVAAFLLYMVKYQVQSLRTQIAETTRELNAEKEAMHVAAAEWSYLNRPQRLQQLAAKYLSSDSLTVEQIAEVEAIPFPSTVHASIDSNDAIQPASVTFKKNAGDER